MSSLITRVARSLVQLATCIALLGSTVLPVSAQPASARDGLWIGGGLGVGVGRAHCEICANTREDAMSGYVKVGGTPSQHLLIGVEGNGWTASDEEVRKYLGAVNAIAYWYPSRRGGAWYFKGGIGVLAYRAEERSGDGEPITARSVSGQFGAGYDLRVLPTVSLTPYLNFVSSFYADLHSEGQEITNVNLTLIQLGVGLTLH